LETLLLAACAFFGFLIASMPSKEVPNPDLDKHFEVSDPDVIQVTQDVEREEDDEPDLVTVPYGKKEHATRMGGQIFGILCWLLIPFQPAQDTPPLDGPYSIFLQYLGLVVTALSAGLMAVAAAPNLGAPKLNLGIVREFKRGGLYNLMRFPVHFSIIVLYLGLAMVNRAAVPIYITPLIPYTMWRMLVNEDALRRADFGPAYEGYQKRLPALAPVPVIGVMILVWAAGAGLAYSDIAANVPLDTGW